MRNLSDRIAALSPEQRALFEQQLKKKNLDTKLQIKKEASIPRRGHEGPSPLSIDQERLWFFHQMHPDKPIYNVYGAIRLKGNLNIPVMERALNEIIRRHESWRTTFDMIDGQPMQMVRPEVTIRFDQVDLGHLPEDVRGVEAQRELSQEVRVPFDLVNGPLLRVKLLHLADDQFILILTVHHLVTDAVTFSILFAELMLHYKAFLQGESSPLPEPSIQYADFAEWQRNHLQGDVKTKLVNYWQETLAGSEFVLNLPTDHPRPSVPTYQGARHYFEVSNQVVTALKALGQRYGASPFMTMLAAFQVLLYRYSGQEDILVGTPTANRNVQELERAMGYFLTSSVIRTQVAGDRTFADLLKEVRDASLGAVAHRDLPFGLLLDEIKPKRDLSRNPIFQAMFTYVDVPEESLQLPGLELQFELADAGTAIYDISLGMTERENGVESFFEYSPDLFEGTTIARLEQHFQRLLQGIIENPEQQVAKLPMLTEPEREQLLVAWNETQLEMAQELCIHQLFERQVELTPDAVAVVFEAEQLTYHELNQRANQVAYLLREQGVGPDVLVGVCMERSLEMIVGLLGTLKAGGAYVPLDPGYPRERVAFVSADAKLSVVLTQAGLKSLFAGSDVNTLCLDEDAQRVALQPITNPDSGVQAHHLSYVIYTSGSTGQPKGVMVEHRNVLNFLAGMDQRVGLQEGDALLAVTSYAFDISVLELFWTITRGIKVVILAEGSMGTTYGLEGQIKRHGITVLQGTPSLFKLMMLNEEAVQALKGLRLLLLGGESLPPALASQIKEQFTARLLNMYGPTETTIWSAVYEVESVGAQVPIGGPIANTAFYVLDQYGQPVPVGVAGELHIGGRGVTRGYWQRPELTAERFVANPFGTGERLYKTGDAVRWLPCGDLEFIGRIDDQVKVRGFRIELGEIETVMSEHPAVRETVVIARRDAQGDMRLVGYLVAETGRGLSSAELRVYLKEKLPEYMVPTVYVTLDQMPLTPNGKIDRQALPEPDGDVGQVEYIAPRNAVEEVLVKIWQDVLGIECVGVTANFFEIGGHSLAAMGMVSRVRETFQVNMPLHRLFQVSTIEGLATVLREYEAKPGQVEAVARLRQKLASMSEDELKAMLEAKKKTRG